MKTENTVVSTFFDNLLEGMTASEIKSFNQAIIANSPVRLEFQEIDSSTDETTPPDYPST